MRKIFQSKLFNLLTIMGALCGTMPKVSAQDKAQEKGETLTVNMPVNVNVEKKEAVATFAEMALKPGAVYQKGDNSIEARWWAYRAGYSDGTKTDWMTTKLYLEGNTPDLNLRLGKVGMYRAPYATFQAVPMTPGLDNYRIGCGDNNLVVGAHLYHKPSGFGLGLISKEARVTMKNWDVGLFTYEKQWGALGVAGHLGVSNDGLHRAGATLHYKLNKQTTLAGEIIRKDGINHGLFGARYDVTDKMGVFVGGQVSDSSRTNTSGWVAGGADYKLGHGLTFTVVGKQEVFNSHGTNLECALKWSGELKKVFSR